MDQDPSNHSSPFLEELGEQLYQAHVPKLPLHTRAIEAMVQLRVELDFMAHYAAHFADTPPETPQPKNK